MVISRKDELMEVEPDEPEMLHSILSKLPKPLDLDELIASSVELFTRHPPEHLPGKAWRHVSSSSVLKTTRDWRKVATQSLSEGERCFAREAAEIRRRETIVRLQKRAGMMVTRYRRPAAWTSSALLFAVLALYLRGNTHVLAVDAWTWPIDWMRHSKAIIWHWISR